MDIECRNLRFNLEKELDRKARDALLAVPVGQRNQHILNAICAYGERQSEEERREQFARYIAEVVVDMLSDTAIPVSRRASETEQEPDAAVYDQSMAITEDFLSHWC